MLKTLSFVRVVLALYAELINCNRRSFHVDTGGGGWGDEITPSVVGVIVTCIAEVGL